jgi:hypothetical protein
MTVNCQDTAKSSDTDTHDHENVALLLGAADDNMDDNNVLCERTWTITSDTKKFLLEYVDLKAVRV